ncbi:hypothetical protein YC2023_061575 [Brassica napus]
MFRLDSQCFSIYLNFFAESKLRPRSKKKKTNTPNDGEIDKIRVSSFRIPLIGFIVQDCDLQSHTIIQVINGIATLLSGPRYMLLRIKCIRWFNLSRASGIFILLASLVLDILEYKSINDSEKQVKQLGAVSTIKLPKNWLKSQNFQEQCIFSVIEHLAGHFAQWSFHMSFPELAIIPIMRLNKFGERITLEGLKLVLNIEFVRLSKHHRQRSWNKKEVRQV